MANSKELMQQFEELKALATDPDYIENQPEGDNIIQRLRDLNGQIRQARQREAVDYNCDRFLYE